MTTHPHWITVIETGATDVYPSGIRVTAFHSLADAQEDVLEFINDEFDDEEVGIDPDPDHELELPLTDADHAMEEYQRIRNRFAFIEDQGA